MTSLGGVLFSGIGTDNMYWYYGIGISTNTDT